MNIYDIYDPTIHSDFRVKEVDSGFLIRIKRSKYVTKIPNQTSPEIAYLSGVIAGDGSFHRSRRKGIRFPRVSIVITNKTSSFLQYINEILEKNFNYGGNFFKTSGRGCYDLLIQNRVIFTYFSRYIKIPVSKELDFPSIFTEPNEIRNFIAGFFDTDGYYSRGSFGIMLWEKSTPALEAIKLHLNSFGIETGKTYHGAIRVADKTYYRVSMRVRKKSSARFFQEIPIRHPKYEWARGESDSISPVFSRFGANAPKL
ncbi:MAG: LAGLIDADG family homing endonuclease [Candidatus Micrarchaeota archaeon]